VARRTRERPCCVDASGADSAVFIGDDVNDEAVFANAPPDGSAASFFIDTQVPLLQDMIDLLSRQSARRRH
jgi:trehalose-6-phosphatase